LDIQVIDNKDNLLSGISGIIIISRKDAKEKIQVK